MSKSKFFRAAVGVGVPQQNRLPIPVRRWHTLNPIVSLVFPCFPLYVCLLFIIVRVLDMHLMKATYLLTYLS